jgi:hypothetical protein
MPFPAVRNTTKILSGKHCSCYPQGEHVLVARPWSFYVGQAEGRTFDVMELIGGAEELAAIFTLKMATGVFVETLDNSKHSTRLIPESRSFTMNTGSENLNKDLHNYRR